MTGSCRISPGARVDLDRGRDRVRLPSRVGESGDVNTRPIGAGGPRDEARGRGDRAGDPGRLLTGLLALYLTPALLVVLLIGGAGMLILAAARAIASMADGAEPRPHSPVGPGPSAH